MISRFRRWHLIRPLFMRMETDSSRSKIDTTNTGPVVGCVLMIEGSRQKLMIIDQPDAYTIYVSPIREWIREWVWATGVALIILAEAVAVWRFIP